MSGSASLKTTPALRLFSSPHTPLDDWHSVSELAPKAPLSADAQTPAINSLRTFDIRGKYSIDIVLIINPWCN